jgi:plastocyanin
VDISEGDYVEFYVADGRVHTVSFPPDSLTEAARLFLTGSEQDASPPLLERGARFVLTFRDAPEARYPFLSAAHGDTAYGVVVVGGGGTDEARVTGGGGTGSPGGLNGPGGRP